MSIDYTETDINNSICEAVGCFAKATDKVELEGGTFGVISVLVCRNCIGKFQDDGAPLTNARSECSRMEKTSKFEVILEIGLATIHPSDQIDIDDDVMLSSCDSICAECDNDHSFQPNFEGVRTSIDAIPKIFPRLIYKAGEIY